MVVVNNVVFEQVLTDVVVILGFGCLRTNVVVSVSIRCFGCCYSEILVHCYINIVCVE